VCVSLCVEEGKGRGGGDGKGRVRGPVKTLLAGQAGD